MNIPDKFKFKTKINFSAVYQASKVSTGYLIEWDGGSTGFSFEDVSRCITEGTWTLLETNKEEVFNSCKESLKDHVEQLLDLDVRAAEIEIEFLHYIRKLIYAERH